MVRSEDAVEPLAGLVVFDSVDQDIFAARHDGQTLDESMQALKTLVIFLGVLIVFMMGVLAYGIVVKFGKVVDEKETPVPATPVIAGSWDRTRVPLPAGARVAETIVSGRRMVVRLVMPDESQRYLVFDLESGRQLGRIHLEPEDAAQ